MCVKLGNGGELHQLAGFIRVVNLEISNKSVAVPRQDSILPDRAHAVLSRHCNIYMYSYYHTNEVWRVPTSAKRYEEAIEHYTLALDLDPTVAVYYGNRSFAHLKMESYGFALMDASSALELDKTYIKV